MPDLYTAWYIVGRSKPGHYCPLCGLLLLIKGSIGRCKPCDLTVNVHTGEYVTTTGSLVRATVRKLRGELNGMPPGLDDPLAADFELLRLRGNHLFASSLLCDPGDPEPLSIKLKGDVGD